MPRFFMLPTIRFLVSISSLLLTVFCSWSLAEEKDSIGGEAFPVSVDAEAGEYCLIVVPDTQRYAAFFPHIFRDQFRWIRDYAQKLNTQFVIHVGDVVEEGEDVEWIVADQAFSMIEDVVPFIVVPGNHDIDPEPGDVGIRASTKFNAVFSPKRFIGKTWYGGNQGLTNDNSFSYFKGGGEEFMLMGIEYGPTDETLAWADLVISNHDQKVILVTHCYMYDDDTRLGDGDKWSPKAKNPGWNDGEDIWKKLVEKNDNIVMVLSGHVKGDGTGLLISENENGKPVLQMLANYQFLVHGGQGWLRILK
ncbi:MAG: metallophosphoesterase, partial [Verrucomicrobiae bacterium]|nr:metallophosphoesterase [Verrucomicrobiae bacterium]